MRTTTESAKNTFKKSQADMLIEEIQETEEEAVWN